MEMDVVHSQSGQESSVCMVCLSFVVQTKLESKVEFYSHICTKPDKNMCSMLDFVLFMIKIK